LESIVINGGQRLHGTVSTSGAKNAALPILISALLADGTHEFSRVPVLRDIDSTDQLLTELGCTFEYGENSLKVHVAPPKSPVAPYDLVRKMRASILCLGPLLARYGEARVSLPGGCAIGSRPICYWFASDRPACPDYAKTGCTYRYFRGLRDRQSEAPHR